MNSSKKKKNSADNILINIDKFTKIYDFSKTEKKNFFEKKKFSASRIYDFDFNKNLNIPVRMNSS